MGVDPATGRAPLDEFRAPGNGRNERHLNNLYTYFWRWATWKAFESTAHRELEGADQGVVCFVTATGYLTGPGFAGMREYLRRQCSAGWVINITPEGINPPPGHGVFAIQTPVAVGVFVRGSHTDTDTPAPIYYRNVIGTKAQKFEQFPEIHLTGDGWQEAPTAWEAPFTPVSGAEWTSFPSVRDIYPWYSSGIATHRTWVHSPSPTTLQYRLNTVVAETDQAKKSDLFRDNRDTGITRPKAPLPARVDAYGNFDTYQNTKVPFAEETFIPDAKLVRFGFRSFDRQWIIADSRLIHDSRRNLWRGRIPGQVYITEQHSVHPKNGPGLYFSGLIPDMNAFNNRGGRTLPELLPDGRPNLPPGLLEALKNNLGREITGGDVTAYVAGITGHPGYVETFDDELRTPGIRVPLTADRDLWHRAVELGRKVLWCHTYGLAGDWEGQASVASPTSDLELPRYEQSMKSALPSTVDYDETTHVLHLGAGAWGYVTPQVRNYMVGGLNVIDTWVGKRTVSPVGKKTSPLDHIVPETWETEWSTEFTELLCALTRLVSMEAEQEDLLAAVLEGPLLSREDLAGGGVAWPPPNRSVKPSGA